MYEYRDIHEYHNKCYYCLCNKCNKESCKLINCELCNGGKNECIEKCSKKKVNS